MVERLTPMLLGENPMRTEHLWQLMFRGGFFPLGRVGCAALSAIDIALWDLKAKALGVPLYELLGGRVRDRVVCYPHVRGPSTAELVADAQQKQADGWKFVRFDPRVEEDGATIDQPAAARRCVAEFAAVREACGDDVEILVDLHTRFDPTDAIFICRQLEAYRPYFVEDPIRMENFDSFRKLSRHVNVPLAAGEQYATKWEFRQQIEEELIDFARVDVCIVGGITETLKIAGWCETHYIPMAFHNPLGPVATAASLHLDLALSNFAVQELARVPGSVLPELFPVQSSPVIWGDRIFLTAAENRGQKRTVLCINRNDGQILWKKVAWTGESEPTHRMNGWASATCATDGKHVYAFFGKGGGLFCYTVGGELVWNKELGEFTSPWGTAASPILVGDLVIQNCDADANAYIVAFNKTTGKQVWKTARENKRGWSSPILVKAAGREEVVVNGHSGARAYDPATGKLLWYCKSFNGRGSPTVTPSDSGLLHVVNGLRGDIYAVKPGGSGTVTGTHMAWHTPRGGGRDLPSPIAIGKYLLVINMKGILTVYDTATGKELSKTRVGGNYSATPIAYQGHAAFIGENGETLIVKPGKQPTLIARNKLGQQGREIYRASITPSDGQLFIRSTTTLYCIGKRKSQ
eukprot:g5267.t1